MSVHVWVVIDLESERIKMLHNKAAAYFIKALWIKDYEGFEDKPRVYIRKHVLG